MSDERVLEELARRLGEVRCAVAFTGAGVSTESGIADFRSPGGIWSRYKPVLFQDFLADAEARRRYWAMKKEAHAEFAGARPNVAHEVLAALERAGMLRAVITQNIDGLHQDAGSRRVLELHGTGRFVVCLTCGRRFPAGEIVELMEREGIEVPECGECGGFLKPATISFGQSLPEDVLEESRRLAVESDLFVAIGSSLVVHPAAALPQIAAESGAALFIINRDETPLDPIAEHVVRRPIGEAMERVREHLAERLGPAG